MRSDDPLCDSALLELARSPLSPELGELVGQFLGPSANRWAQYARQGANERCDIGHRRLVTGQLMLQVQVPGPLKERFWTAGVAV